MTRRRMSVLALAALLPGCYQYAESTVADISPGTDIRVDISAPRPVSIMTDTGAATYRNVAAMMGRVVGQRGDTLVLAESCLIPAGRARGAQSLRGRVSYLPDATDRVQRRRLDGPQTTVAVLVPVGVIVFLLATLEFPASEGSPY